MELSGTLENSKFSKKGYIRFPALATTSATARATAARTGTSKKKYVFLSKNNNFPRAARFFVHFRCSLHHYDVKLPKCTFYGGRKQVTTNFSFSPLQT